MKDVADHGDGCVVDTVDARGAPRFEPGVVDNFVAKNTFVLGGDVRNISPESHIANKGGWQTVGGVVGGARSRRPVKRRNDAGIEGCHQMIGTDVHAADGCRGGVASSRRVGGQDGSGGVKFHDRGWEFSANEQRGALGCEMDDISPAHPRVHPYGVCQVVTHDAGSIAGADVENTVPLDDGGHFVALWSAGEQNMAFKQRVLLRGKMSERARPVVDKKCWSARGSSTLSGPGHQPSTARAEVEIGQCIGGGKHAVGRVV